MRKTMMIVACIAVLAVMVIVQSAAAQGKLEGAWKVTEITLTGPNALTNTAPQPGIWMFAKKHCSSVGISGAKPQPDLPQKDATDAQKVATWTPLIANAGTYEIKGTTITIHPIVGKNPFPPGAFTTFDYRIEGNTLTVTLKTTSDGPVANPYTLKLVRVE